MIKRVVVAMIVFVLAGMQVVPLGYAQTSATGPSGQASATVNTSLEFSLARVVRMESGVDTDPWNEGTIMTTPSFNFGALVPVEDTDGTLLYMRGTYFYYVLMSAATAGRRYAIRETGGQLTSGSRTLPRESVLLYPDYQWADQLGGVAQGAPPGTASVGAVTTASATDSLVYQSDTLGQSRIVRAILAISGPAAGFTYPTNYSRGHDGLGVGQGTQQQYTSWKPIGLDQAAGTYTATMTFTLVLN
jgi:hypothetical protein